VRLFAGIDLDAPVRSAAAAATDHLRAELPRVDPDFAARWIPPANLHITLWFLGEVADEAATAVVAALRQPFPTASFPLVLRGCGAFPRSGPPRVLWVGVSRGAPEMRALYGELADRLVPLGFPREPRPYSPHLTVARVKASGRGTARAVRQLLAETAADCGTSAVTAVTLFRSRLSPRGAAYEPILRVPLV
jgi:RNA 2',3'-cyclic 3'-phosphodiesterase